MPLELLANNMEPGLVAIGHVVFEESVLYEFNS